MTPIKTNVTNVNLVADGCGNLPAYKGDDYFCTYWKPSIEELAMLNAGMPVKLSILGKGHPPVAVEVDTL